MFERRCVCYLRTLAPASGDQNIFKNLELVFGTETRERVKDKDYFNVVQAYRHYKRLLKKGINVYRTIFF